MHHVFSQGVDLSFRYIHTLQNLYNIIVKIPIFLTLKLLLFLSSYVTQPLP